MKKIIIAAVILIMIAGGQKAYAQDAVKNEPEGSTPKIVENGAAPAVCYQTDAGVSLPAQKGSTPKIIREIPRYHYYDVPRAKVTTYETRVIPVYKFAIWGVTVTADTKTNTIKITGVNTTMVKKSKSTIEITGVNTTTVTKSESTITVKPVK